MLKKIYLTTCGDQNLLSKVLYFLKSQKFGTQSKVVVLDKRPILKHLNMTCQEYLYRQTSHKSFSSENAIKQYFKEANKEHIVELYSHLLKIEDKPINTLQIKDHILIKFICALIKEDQIIILDRLDEYLNEENLRMISQALTSDKSYFKQIFIRSEKTKFWLPIANRILEIKKASFKLSVWDPSLDDSKLEVLSNAS